MAGSRKGAESNYPSATYERTAGPQTVPPSNAAHPADVARHDATRVTVVTARKAQRSA